MIATLMSVASRNDALVVPPAATTAGRSVSPVSQTGKPNPSTRLDLTLGITVLSFHDADGQVVASTPTQQQLNTYLMFGVPGQAARPAASVEGSPGLGLLA